MKTAIKDVSPMPNPTLYRRRIDNEVYIKLDDEFQIKVTIENGHLIGKGSAEAVNPDEIVIV